MDISDLRVGVRVGQRVILAIDAKARKRDRVTLKCDCGDVSEVYVHTLLVRPSGGCQSCFRKQKEHELTVAHQAELVAKYPIGLRLGSRVVSGAPHRNGELWKLPMRCDCGSEDDVSFRSLNRGTGGRCGECRASVAWRHFPAPQDRAPRVLSVPDQIAATEPDKDEVTASAETRYRRAELAEINSKFLYQREAEPLCSCGSTRIYEGKSWLQCMRCGRAWAKKKKGAVIT